MNKTKIDEKIERVVAYLEKLNLEKQAEEELAEDRKRNYKKAPLLSEITRGLGIATLKPINNPGYRTEPVKEETLNEETPYITAFGFVRSDIKNMFLKLNKKEQINFNQFKIIMSKIFDNIRPGDLK